MGRLYSNHEGGMDPASTTEKKMTGHHDLDLAIGALLKMGSWIVPCMIVSWIACEVGEFMKPWRF